MTKLWIVALVVAGAMLVVVGVVFVAQRSVLFPAPPPRGTAARGAAELIALGSSTSAA